MYLLLTKRPQNIIRLTEEAGGLPPNVALGTTVEDQDRADMNVPALLWAKAALRPLFVFLSCEPLLGRIDLTEITEGDGTMDALQPRRWEDEMETWRETSDTWEEDFTDWFGLHELPDPGPMHPGLDWVITGGETDQGSHRARPTNPQWIRDIRDQCAAAGVPYHHKQNGEWVSVSEVEGEGDHYHFPDGRTVRRVGKALSGRTIDLVTHDAFPEVPAL